MAQVPNPLNLFPQPLFEFSAYTTPSDASKEKNYAPWHKHKTTYKENCLAFIINTSTETQPENLQHNKPTTKQERVTKKTVKTEPLRWCHINEQKMVPYHTGPQISFVFTSCPNEKYGGIAKLSFNWEIRVRRGNPNETDEEDDREKRRTKLLPIHNKPQISSTSLFIYLLLL